MDSGECRFRGSSYRINGRDRPALRQFINRLCKLGECSTHVATLVDSLASLVRFAQFEGDAPAADGTPRGRFLPMVQNRKGHGGAPL